MELSVHLHQDGVRNTESIPGSLIKRHEHGELVTKVFHSVQFSRICLFATPWTAARQASLSITNSRSLLKLRSIELVMPSHHLIFCRPSIFLLLPSIFPSMRGFFSESALCIRWPKYWSFSFSISPSNEHPGLISFRINSKYSLEGLMLKLKLQYFGHLLRRADSLEKTLMLGKIEGKRRKG